MQMPSGSSRYAALLSSAELAKFLGVPVNTVYVYAAPLVRAWVYADGRIIWSEESSQSSRPVPEGANELTSGYLEQRLTPEGVELLRSEVIGLLERSAHLVSRRSRPIEPDLPADRLIVPLPRLRGVWKCATATGSSASVGTTWERRSTWRHVATPEQLAALRRVDALLTDTASVLPASAWAVREIRAYVPSHYAVCIDTSPPKDASQLLSLLPTRAADLLRDKSRTRLEADVVANIDQVPGHMVVHRPIGHVLLQADDRGGPRGRGRSLRARSGPELPRRRPGVSVAEAVNNLSPTSIWFEPYFPHGQVTCSACG